MSLAQGSGASLGRILYHSASPYSSKVRMAANYAGCRLEQVRVSTADRPQELVEANPLVKIPVLIAQGGTPIFDSRAITRYIDRASGGRLYPIAPALLTACEVMEALADGLCDSMAAHVYERRYRPAEKVHQPWLDKQWGKVVETFAYLETHLPGLPERTDVGHIALRAALGYYQFRFAESGLSIPAHVAKWIDAFDERHPELISCLPS